MYHCRIQIYCIGGEPGIFSALKEMPPLEHFDHAFLESCRPEAALLAEADVILADLRGMDAARVLPVLAAGKKPEAELILLAGADQAAALPDGLLPELRDVWTLPMAERELRFHFLKWQENYKLGRDYWQAGQFLDACIEGSPNPVWFKARDGACVKVNGSFCEAVHLTRQQAEGHGNAGAWDGAEIGGACLRADYEAAGRRETRVSEETVHTGGEEMLLTVYRSPLYDLDGSVMGTAGMAVNVTRERAYEREIIEKNRTLGMLFSTLDCGVIYHSVDGRHIESINRAALRLLGYESAEEMLEDGFALVAQSVLDEDKPKLRECITSLTKVGDSVSVEYRVRHRDGETLDILGNVKLVEKDGELFYQRFLLDYTAQRRLQEQKWAEKDREVRYQEQLFDIFSAFLADNVDDIYIMMNERGDKAEFVSPNVERVLGVSEEEILEDLSRLGRAKYITGGEISREGLAALEPGMALEPVETERVNRKTGERRWFLENVCCASVQGIKKTFVYISDRTKERMTQNTLSEALNMAKVASKAKSAFLSSVSHDIRTPMNAIMGFLELLRKEADNPESVRDYTQKISAASQHLLGLINDVLDMNKIESGSAVLNISELNLAEIIDEINTIIRPQARAKGQNFDIYATSLANEHLLGDKLRINQILINILSNAVKYTQKGGTISMSAEELPQVDQNYSRIRFTIRDNGQGMSEDYLKVIFDPFTREQTTMLNKIQGTGLGMAITKNLVDLMNGSIQVDSRLGEGSTFTVELELRVQPREDDPGFWDRHSVARMIVADDNEDICRDVVKKMGETGVETHYATHGAQAVDMIRAAREAGRPYDLILLDWKMPDLDGLATARLIRKNYPDKIPILLFTAYDWSDIEQEAMEVGIEHFLPKPFFMSNFKDAIRRMLGKKEEDEPAGGGASVVDGKHVLVVDDIEVNRMILVKILGTLGARCDVAADGQEAVAMFEQSRPGEYDMILMDIQMPIMNGHEATKAIRAGSHPSAQSIPIIAMTANAFVDDVRDALRAGMDAHIPKPIVLDQLERTIREVLDRKNKLTCERIIP